MTSELPYHTKLAKKLERKAKQYRRLGRDRYAAELDDLANQIGSGLPYMNVIDTACIDAGEFSEYLERIWTLAREESILHPRDTTPPGLITLEWLRAVGADPTCHSYTAVAKEWGESHQMTLNTFKRAAKLHCDLSWLAGKLLSDEAWIYYKTKRAQAWARYEAGRIETWAHYDAEIAKTWAHHEAEIAEALWHAWQVEISATHIETNPKGKRDDP